MQHPACSIDLGNVTRVEHGLPAELLDLDDDLCAGVSIELVDDDARAVPGELEGLTAADAAAGTGHDGDFPRQELSVVHHGA